MRFVATVALGLSLAVASHADGQPALTTPGRHLIEVTSTADRSRQPSTLTVPPSTPANTSRYPLLVLLHTWSNNLEQRFPAVETGAASRGWLLLEPNFRGRDNRPQACGSSLAQQDILDAVDWVRRRLPVDSTRIYLLGFSGGGFMTMLMAARHPGPWAAASAWAGISDLAEWYVERQHDDYYGPMLRACLGGRPTISASAAATARARSPVTYLTPALPVPLDLEAGRSDTVVDFTHTLRAFQAIAPNAITSDEIAQLVAAGRGLATPAPSDTAADAVLGRRVFLRRSAGASRVTIFDGVHEMIAPPAMAWLAGHQKPPGSRTRE